jgi:hypothetical protein
LAVIFLAFRIAGLGLGAGASLAAGCSATTAGAGADSGVTSGADGFSTTAATAAGSAAETASGLDAQADKAKAERSNVTGMATLNIRDMPFSHNAVIELISVWNHPTVRSHWIDMTGRGFQLIYRTTQDESAEMQDSGLITTGSLGRHNRKTSLNRLW